ncbi:MAG: EVE domain-containing protein [Planctomycetes bacterium]|nr:EVE domain-containing protein [Planctomycetota bacterium]
MGKAGKRWWLFKSEPEEFSFGDLLKAPRKRTFWNGVRNYQARNLLRDEVQVGDLVLYYHSNAQPSGVAGIAEVVGAASADPTQFESGDYHEPRATKDAPVWFGVEVAAVKALPRLVALEELKASAALAQMGVVRKGNRLSVQPLTQAEFDEVVRMAARKV